MKKYIISIFVVLVSVVLARAQNNEGTTRFAPPEKGKFTAAILFGRGNVLTSGLVNTMPAGSNIYWSVPGDAPSANMVSVNNNDVTNMIGAEARFFLSGKVALKLSGVGVIRNTPSHVNIPAVIDPDSDNATWLPAYDAVQGDDQINYNVNLGAEYHFTTANARLQPYLGVDAIFQYGLQSAYDPTIEDVEGEPRIVDVGMRNVEVVGFGGAFVGGIDYYLLEGFYFGVSIKPFNYLYAYNVKDPAPGLEVLEADTHTYSFFTQPIIKLGFKF